MISLLSDFESHFQEYFTPNQFQTLSILISLINQYRQVKIEKLAGYFPLPIQFESRRKHLQRFLVLMRRNKNKQKFYQQGIKVKEKLEKLYSESIS